MKLTKQGVRDLSVLPGTKVGKRPSPTAVRLASGVVCPHDSTQPSTREEYSECGCYTYYVPVTECVECREVL